MMLQSNKVTKRQEEMKFSAFEDCATENTTNKRSLEAYRINCFQSVANRVPVSCCFSGIHESCSNSLHDSRHWLS